VTLLAATPDALYRVEDGDVEQVVDRGVRQVRATPGTALAATESGVLESRDGGETWTDTGLPTDDVHSVALSTNGALAGTRPLAVYRREDSEWTELDGLGDLAARAGWPTPSFRDEAWARSVAEDAAGRVLVGVEVGGVAVRERDGSWRRGGPTESDPAEHQRCDDVHHVAARAAGDWLLATGDGVFHSRDAGDSWTRLDTGSRRYARELSVGEGTLTVGVNDSPPRWRPPDAALYAGPPGALDTVSYPGAPERFVVSFAHADDGLYAGTNDGTVLHVTAASAEPVASVPVSEHAETAYGVRSLAVA
jgi:hypothetical protein